MINSIALASGIVSIVFLVVVIAMGVIGIVHTRGTARGLVGSGAAAIVLSRIAPIVVGALMSTQTSSDDGLGAVLMMQIVIPNFFFILGVILLVLAAITASKGQRPQDVGAPAEDFPRYPDPQGDGPGYPGRPQPGGLQPDRQ